MKRFYKFSLFFIMILMSVTTVFAGENSYELVKEMTYKSIKKTQLKSGFIEVAIGQKDFVQYQEDGDIVIDPAPDEIREDEYGNLYAYYDMTGFRPGNIFTIKITRKIDVGTFEQDISVRSDTEVTEENKIYLESQLKIESDDEKIIAKAKELTYEISSDYKKALAIFEYVNTQMEYTTPGSQYANKGALFALENKKGVCEEFATLFVALCRASDIPARAVVGYKFETITNTDEETGETTEEYELINHVWGEFYLEEYGWIPVEPTVIYMPQGERVAYTEAFGKITNTEYIATGIYNYEKANRTMQYVTEDTFSETLVKVSDEVVEEHEFSDVTENYAWASDAINRLYSLGIVKGYSEDEFGPEKNISRIEFITMLSRTLKQMGYYAAEGGQVYYHMDYDQTHWSKEEYDYLMRCYHAINPADIASMGYYDLVEVFGSTLDMNKAITREEVVALLDSFLNDATTDADFTDISGSKFKRSILKAYENGLINGYPDGTFRPSNKITRAEMAVILKRYIGEYIVI